MSRRIGRKSYLIRIHDPKMVKHCRDVRKARKVKE